MNDREREDVNAFRHLVSALLNLSFGSPQPVIRLSPTCHSALPNLSFGSPQPVPQLSPTCPSGSPCLYFPLTSSSSNYSARDTKRLGATIDVEQSAVRFLGSLVLVRSP